MEVIFSYSTTELPAVRGRTMLQVFYLYLELFGAGAVFIFRPKKKWNALIVEPCRCHISVHIKSHIFVFVAKYVFLDFKD